MTVAAACGGSPPPSQPSQDGDGSAVGTGGSGTTAFFVDPNFGGKAQRLTVAEVTWGRLVDVYELTPDDRRILRHRNFLIGQDFTSDADVLLQETPLSQRTVALVRHPLGSAEYEAAIQRLTEGLDPIAPHAGTPGELAAHTMVPRNATISIRFDDLVDAETIGPDTVRLLAGIPAQEPLSVRLLADPNHGGTVEGEDGDPVFHTTRVLIDPTISETELIEEEAKGNAGLYTPNGAGLPESTSLGAANVLLRLPTRTDPSTAQFRVLSSISGRPLAPGGADPVDTTLASEPVLRAFRSGGRTSVTGDPGNGYLRDVDPPRIVGSQRVSLVAVSPTERPGELSVDYRFATDECALAPRAGDLLELPGALSEIVADGELVGADVAGARVRPFGQVDLAAMVGLEALHVTAYRPSEGHVPPCFVTAHPDAGVFPLRDVEPDVELTLRFSEPMDPVALNGLEGIVVARTEDEPGPHDVVVATVQQAPDLHTFTWKPVLPLSHVEGVAERYTVRMDLGGGPPTDLAGNALESPLPHLALELDATAPTDRNGGFVLRFDDVDEDGNGFPEVRGQLLHQEGRVVPRPVTRFSLRADRDSPTVGNMQTLPHGVFASPFDNGVFEPLTPFGSRVMTVWRYADLGLALQDEAFFNVDVEGIAWAPKLGTVVADHYPGFSMSLAHAGRLPDEAADLANAGLWAPASGLVRTSFAENRLDDPENQPMVVHEKGDGYFVDPVETFVAANGNRMMPFPMNRGKAPGEGVTYTWRDTAVLATGGDEGLGIPIGGQVNSGELPSMNEVGTVAGPSFVPSIGLPLLIDMKTWPGGAGGNNPLEVVLGGFPTTFGFDLPADFRVHSTGGVDLNGNVLEVVPDLTELPTGGFHTVPAVAPPGAPSPPSDSLFYVGQLDLVVRISRAHTLWMDTGGSSRWFAPVTVPAPGDQPANTAIEFDFRGALAVAGAPAENAAALDAYGDEPVLGNPPSTYGDPALENASISFEDLASTRWDGPESVEGSRWVQSRMTFVNDIAAGATAELRAVGFVYDLAD